MKFKYAIRKLRIRCYLKPGTLVQIKETNELADNYRGKYGIIINGNTICMDIPIRIVHAYTLNHRIVYVEPEYLKVI